jgi:hypothetical protein
MYLVAGYHGRLCPFTFGVKIQLDNGDFSSGLYIIQPLVR